MVRTERLEHPKFKFEVFKSGETGGNEKNNYIINKKTGFQF